MSHTPALATAVADAIMHKMCRDAIRDGLAEHWEDKFADEEVNRARMSLYSQLSEFEVWIVDGEYIRLKLDEEFTNFGQHYAFLWIPEHELWIDRTVTEDEYGYYIDHMIVEYREMARGTSYDKALEKGDRKERDERQSAEGKYRGPLGAPDAAERCHIGPWDTWSNDHVKTWIVDGAIIRKDYDPDFTEGGHDCVYGYFIPPGEVWLDNENIAEEQPFFVLHELHERSLMAAGMKYNEAHKKSSELEHEARLEPSTLDAKIAEALAANEHPVIIHHSHNGVAHMDKRAGHKPKISDAKKTRLFNAMFRRAAKHEKRIKSVMRGHFEKERRIMIANMKHAGHQKDYRPDLIDRWLYPSTVMKKLLADALKPVFKTTMSDEGQAIADAYGFDIAFDVTSPFVNEILRSYPIALSGNIEATSLDALRTTLIDGMNAGEGIPQLTDRVNALFSNWSDYRAEMVARTEVSNAQNQAAIESYRQSGIEQKQWLTFFDDATCEECDGLDGEIVDVDDNFSNGDDGPPDHPNCLTGNMKVLAVKDGHEIYVPISELKIGDYVYTTQFSPRHIVGIMSREYDGPIVALKSLIDEHRTLMITPNHKMFSGRGAIPAGELKPGDLLEGFDIESAGSDSGIEFSGVMFDEALVGAAHFRGIVFNIEVDDHHSYIVEGYCVLNCRCTSIPVIPEGLLGEEEG